MILFILFVLIMAAYLWQDLRHMKREPYLEDQPTYLTVIPSHVNRSKS